MFLRSIHSKIILWALVPIFFVMGIITLLSFITIKNTALEVVKKRDAVLAEIAAKRLSENLQKYPFFLQTLAESKALQSMNFDHMETTITRTRNWLHFFDGGIYIYDATGKAVCSYPANTSFQDSYFPDKEGFQTIKTTLRPVFSDIIPPGTGGKKTILITVPIIGSDSEFIGAVAGICSVKYSTLGTTYTKVLEYKSGESSYAYLVDGRGKVLYHRHSSLIGSRIETGEAVEKVTSGLTGATVTKNLAGEMAISGFAPVPGTGWGIVTQGNWSVIQDLIEFYTRLFLTILWGGGTISALLVFYFIQRLLEPVRALTKGAEQIANGHYIEIPVKKTGDEIEVLSRQFNSMARATKVSFKNINNRVNELDRARKALKQSKEKINGIINAVNDAMLMVDDKGQILWINDKGRKRFGAQAEESPYQEILYGQKSVPDDCIIKKCFVDGIENDTEIQIFSHGKFQDYWCTCNVVHRNRAGNVNRVVVVCRNLTEKKRLRAEVLRNAQLAALGELAAGIAHEINNPINGIINYAQIIEDNWHTDHPQSHDQLPGRIMKEGERIALIVSKLLSFARAGKEKKQPITIQGVVDDVLDLTRAMIKKEHIQVEIEIAGNLPAVRAVIHQIQQIFLNVIGNARYALNQKYQGNNPEKKITITCSTVERNGIPMVRTSFLDNGTGIPKAIRDKICNPFFSTKPHDQGTGLGLSISYGIIEEHDGELEINSIHGEWTEVVIDLPAW